MGIPELRVLDIEGFKKGFLRGSSNWAWKKQGLLCGGLDVGKEAGGIFRVRARQGLWARGALLHPST